MTDKHCNHDAPAIHNHRCECGVYVGVPGGWDGLVLSFGEGCDDDTINRTLGAYFGDCVIELTMKDGRRFAVTSTDSVRVDGDLALEFMLHDDETGKPVGPTRTERFADIVGVLIF